MQDKLAKQREETARAKDSNEDLLSQMMPPPPNRIPSAQVQVTQTLGINSNELLEMAAQQSLQEESQPNGGVEVVKKVNINF